MIEYLTMPDLNQAQVYNPKNIIIYNPILDYAFQAQVYYLY